MIKRKADPTSFTAESAPGPTPAPSTRRLLRLPRGPVSTPAPSPGPPPEPVTTPSHHPKVHSRASASARREHALAIILSRKPRETMQDLCTRTGISFATLNRYMRDATFLAELRQRTNADLEGARPRVVDQLIRGATNPFNKQQSAMMRIFFSLTGDLSAGTGINVQVNNTINGASSGSEDFVIRPEMLSLELRRRIIEELTAGGHLREKTIEAEVVERHLIKEVDHGTQVAYVADVVDTPDTPDDADTPEGPEHTGPDTSPAPDLATPADEWNTLNS